MSSSLVGPSSGRGVLVDVPALREAVETGPVRAGVVREQDGVACDLSVLKVAANGAVTVGEDGDDDRDAAADPANTQWQRDFAEKFVADSPNLGVKGLEPDGSSPALRSVLVHMIEEYARHCGHADLLRERVDGRIGQ